MLPYYHIETKTQNEVNLSLRFNHLSRVSILTKTSAEFFIPEAVKFFSFLVSGSGVANLIFLAIFGVTSVIASKL